jgi:hypothetical protein
METYETFSTRKILKVTLTRLFMAEGEKKKKKGHKQQSDN